MRFAVDAERCAFNRPFDASPVGDARAPARRLAQEKRAHGIRGDNADIFLSKNVPFVRHGDIAARQCVDRITAQKRGWLAAQTLAGVDER